jgi:hypothetical protein
VGLKDVDFDVDENRLEVLGLSLPFRSIDQAEEAMRSSVIQPGKLLDHDGTLHQILAYDGKPVGYSGFMDCVTHSLALTDKGLFEGGRYPGVSLTEPGKQLQWFIRSWMNGGRASPPIWVSLPRPAGDGYLRCWLT